jgi:hypothetical protein
MEMSGKMAKFKKKKITIFINHHICPIFHAKNNLSRLLFNFAHFIGPILTLRGPTSFQLLCLPFNDHHKQHIWVSGDNNHHTKWHWSKSRSKLGQAIILIKPYFSSMFGRINFKLGVKVTHGLPFNWIFLKAFNLHG